MILSKCEPTIQSFCGDFVQKKNKQTNKQRKNLKKKQPNSREDEGVRELLPHIGPLPILIPLKLFLVTNGGKFKIQITY